MSERVTIAIESGVADVRLNRPDKMNALDQAMINAIAQAGEALRKITGLRAILLSGEGRAFCAGLDVASFSAAGLSSLELRPRTHGMSNAFQHAAMLWRELPVPVIAALHGVCFGGGLQIALGADIRIAGPDTRCSFMEIKWGLIPDMGGFALTRSLVRDDILRELVYSGREVRAAEAEALGLVTRIADKPIESAKILAHSIAARSPHAIRAAKRLFAASHDHDFAPLLDAESREQELLLQSPNQREAIQANVENRPARFQD